MKDIAHMLELMDRPAFCVEAGVITAANRAALARQIPLGEPVEPLLVTGGEEYREFTRGWLSLRLDCCGESYDASVSAAEGKHIFTLESQDAEEELRLLALTAQVLRSPLGDVMALVEELPEDMEPDRLARIRKGLYQMLRIVGNLSAQTRPSLEMQDVDTVLRELWEKAESACESRGVKLRYRGTSRPLYSNIDAQLLTRAIYNLLSNSLKFAADGGEIELELSAGKKFYRISVRDWGTSVSSDLDLFNHWRREPGIEDGKSGMGLGLKLVQLAAAAHSGTVWFDRLKGEGFQVILSLPIDQDGVMRSPRYRVSYSGDRDPLLLELSDVLPPEFYQ
ncbi:MAG: HAMP domain-containing histidine kinase [Oscillospiraceae bacterium]|nr:HAMP domain-containing histidine kinase [Oscillospiraceae bacterium]